MEYSHLIILLMLLGSMAAYVPVFMCLFFTAALSFLLFTDPAAAAFSTDAFSQP